MPATRAGLCFAVASLFVLQVTSLQANVALKKSQLDEISIRQEDGKGPRSRSLPEVSPEGSLMVNVPSMPHNAGKTQVPEVAVLLVLGTVAAFFAVVTATPLIDYVSRFHLGLIACAVYTFIAVCVDVSIMAQKQADPLAQPYTFEPCVCVMTVELCKLFLSTMLYTGFQLCKKESPVAVWSTVTSVDVAWWFLPAALFTMNNALVWWAIGKNDSSTYGVLRDTMVLWTAALWKVVFGAELGLWRLSAIGLVFAGCVANQTSKMMGGGYAGFGWASGLILIMTACNALGTVMNEFALKRRPDLDINVHNMILYTLCASFAFGLVMLQRGAHDVFVQGLYSGFNHHAAFTVTLQVTAGLFVSRILAYADSVTKSIAASLRGPILIFVAMAFVETILTPLTWLAIILVFAGCAVFLLQGPLSNAVPKPAAEESKEEDPMIAKVIVFKLPPKEEEEKRLREEDEETIVKTASEAGDSVFEECEPSTTDQEPTATESDAESLATAPPGSPEVYRIDSEDEKENEKHAEEKKEAVQFCIATPAISPRSQQESAVETA